MTILPRTISGQMRLGLLLLFAGIVLAFSICAWRSVSPLPMEIAGVSLGFASEETIEIPVPAYIPGPVYPVYQYFQRLTPLKRMKEGTSEAARMMAEDCKDRNGGRAVEVNVTVPRSCIKELGEYDEVVRVPLGGASTELRKVRIIERAIEAEEPMNEGDYTTIFYMCVSE